jgi:hypothetical protein
MERQIQIYQFPYPLSTVRTCAGGQPNYQLLYSLSPSPNPIFLPRSSHVAAIRLEQLPGGSRDIRYICSLVSYGPFKCIHLVSTSCTRSWERGVWCMDASSVVTRLVI